MAQLHLIRADISQIDDEKIRERYKVDAVVVPSNETLVEGSGAAAAIFKRAGEKELNEARKAVIGRKHGKPGEAYVTDGCNWTGMTLIHAVVPKWVEGDGQKSAQLKECYVSSMKKASARGCKCMATPLLGAGNNGFEDMESFELFKEAVQESSIDIDVVLVLYDS
ncbi:MAG: macro domain-containing protein, partial [Pseudobutyrivibrio sp.]|nr:macro domain-containing protein [Pseudobutyrivibrio sp.]